MEKERQSEEQALADAWAMSGTVDDESATTQHATNDSKIEENGIHENGIDSAEAEDGDQDADDDLMDRISSSPSIDDGKHTAIISNDTLATQTCDDETAFNMPPRRSSLPRSGRFALVRTKDGLKQWLHQSPSGDMQTYTQPHRVSPLLATASLANFLSPQTGHHQEQGRYTLETTEPQDEMFADALFDHFLPEPSAGNAFRLIRPIDMPYMSQLADTVARPRAHGPLTKTSSLDSLTSVDLNDVLLPEHDPLLSPARHLASPTDLCEATHGHHDTTISLDDALLSPISDSGWEDISLQGSEDIDFEFVYALHTFVATVEGQANATKGDTMVLLDDTNSYWWLVRVVKDSSIGL